MLLIQCPWCGERDLTEFSHGGEAHITRPENPDKVSDEEWGEYIFFRNNPKGIQYERWIHSQGCRRWFNAARDTVSDEFLAFYKSGEQPPKIKRRQEARK